MANLKFRYIIVALLLSATAAAASFLKYDATQNDESNLTDLQKIPMQIGEWNGKDFPLDESVYAILETRAIIHRSFVSDRGEDVFLSIVHYNDTKVDFHAPEACLGGRGLKTIKTDKAITLFSDEKQKVVDVAQIVTNRASGQTLTYYFFKSGSYVGSNYIKMRLSIAINKMTNKNTRASLIRVSTSLNSRNESLAEARLINFIEAFYPYIHQSL